MCPVASDIWRTGGRSRASRHRNTGRPGCHFPRQRPDAELLGLRVRNDHTTVARISKRNDPDRTAVQAREGSPAPHRTQRSRRNRRRDAPAGPVSASVPMANKRRIYCTMTLLLTVRAGSCQHALRDAAGRSGSPKGHPCPTHGRVSSDAARRKTQTNSSLARKRTVQGCAGCALSRRGL